MFIEESALEEKLKSWFFSENEKGINIVTLPLRGVDPLAPFIFHLIKEGKTILYITGEEPEDALIINRLESLGFNSKSFELPNITIKDYDGAMAITNNFDLIVYDDINSVPLHNRMEIMSLLNTIGSKSNKILSYSIEKVFKVGQSLFLPWKEKGIFITEPRLITTRLDFSEVIPTALYNFIKFFHEEKRKVIILCPHKSMEKGIINYLLRISPEMSSHIIYGDETDDTAVINTVGKSKDCLFIFLTKVKSYLLAEENFDFIVMDAENKKFSHRDFIYLAQRASLKDKINGELILVSSDLGDNMRRTRDITRDFNKKMWENGYFA